MVHKILQYDTGTYNHTLQLYDKGITMSTTQLATVHSANVPMLVCMIHDLDSSGQPITYLVKGGAFGEPWCRFSWGYCATFQTPLPIPSIILQLSHTKRD